MKTPSVIRLASCAICAGAALSPVAQSKVEQSHLRGKDFEMAWDRKSTIMQPQPGKAYQYQVKHVVGSSLKQGITFSGDNFIGVVKPVKTDEGKDVFIIDDASIKGKVVVDLSSTAKEVASSTKVTSEEIKISESLAALQIVSPTPLHIHNESRDGATTSRTVDLEGDQGSAEMEPSTSDKKDRLRSAKVSGHVKVNVKGVQVVKKVDSSGKVTTEDQPIEIHVTAHDAGLKVTTSEGAKRYVFTVRGDINGTFVQGELNGDMGFEYLQVVTDDKMNVISYKGGQDDAGDRKR